MLNPALHTSTHIIDLGNLSLLSNANQAVYQHLKNTKVRVVYNIAPLTQVISITDITELWKLSRMGIRVRCPSGESCP